MHPLKSSLNDMSEWDWNILGSDSINWSIFHPQTVLNRTPTDKIRIDSFQMPIPGTFNPHPERQLMQRNRKERLFKKFHTEPYPVLPLEDLEVPKIQVPTLHTSSWVLKRRLTLILKVQATFFTKAISVFLSYSWKMFSVWPVGQIFDQYLAIDSNKNCLIA